MLRTSHGAQLGADARHSRLQPLHRGKAYTISPPTGYHAFLSHLANSHFEQAAWVTQPV